MRQNLIEQVLKTVRIYEMVKPGDSVLAAVSGGPDSVFLLHVLNRLKDKFKIKNLAVCNMDHGLRGRESAGDSLFVMELAKESGLKCIHKKINLKKSKKLSTEEVAREARYKFFERAAKKAGANVIATGHTLDDQAETILMRLIKGSSLKGAIGILPVREGGQIRFIRPLLELEKKDIEKYLEGEGIGYRIDSTNLEPIYFRNIVRSDIIPFLERYNPRFKRALFNFAEHLREDFEFIAEEKARLHAGVFKPSGKGIELKLKDIVIQPRALQKEILREALGKVGGEVKRLSFRHWKEMENFIKYKRRGNSLDLPGGVRVTRTGDSLIFRLL